MGEYCEIWKLCINLKNKNVIFSRGKVRKFSKFIWGNDVLDRADSYSYLGSLFNYDGKFNKAKCDLFARGNRAIFSLIPKCRQLNLPIDVQLELFDTLVVPTILYGCEIWGHEWFGISETLHLKFCKIVLSLTKDTPNCMIYGELGRTPIECKIKVKILLFWFKLVKKHNVSNMVYNLIFNMHISGFYNNSWLIFVKKLLMIVVFHIFRMIKILILALLFLKIC